MSLRVVLVDDDAFMADLVAAQLRSFGVREVVTVGDGRAALDAVIEDPRVFQVMLCDLRMPGMDGIELMRHLAQRKGCRSVVLLSGEDDRILASAKQLATAHGIHVLGALRKPVQREQLKRVLRAIVARQPSAKPVRRQGEAFTPDAEDLARGIAEGELEVFYQPRVALGERKVRGVEGLVRWRHKEHGLVPPGSFVPLAERTGQIDALTRVVFDSALAAAARFASAGHELTISLNATVDTLARLDFADSVAALAQKHGVPLSRVIVEVTEGRLVRHYEQVLETLTRLRLNRVGVAIDDFGTGYSTMEQLLRIPFTELKIDRAFVCGAHEDKTTRAILESSVSLARQLGLTSVAEGAETEDDLDLVASVGCDEVQGYYFARPMPEPELLAWVAAFAAGERDAGRARTA